MHKMKPLLILFLLMIAVNLWAQDSSVMTRISVVKEAIGASSAPDSYIDGLPRAAPIVTVSGVVLDSSGKPAHEATVSLELELFEAHR
jgi:hypothetical protein